MLDGFRTQRLDALQHARQLCVSGALVCAPVGAGALRREQAAAQVLEQQTHVFRRLLICNGAIDRRCDRFERLTVAAGAAPRIAHSLARTHKGEPFGERCGVERRQWPQRDTFTIRQRREPGRDDG